MRVTTQILAGRVLADLNATSARQMKVHQQMSSGRRLAVPSDDPVRVVNALRYRSNLAETEQYLNNVSDARGWLDNTDSALQNIASLLQRGRELAVQGAVTALPQSARDAMAEEVRSLRDEVINVGNTNADGRYLFSGTKTLSPAFDPLGAYLGDTGLIQREIGPGVVLAVNVRGDLAIAPAIAALDTLAADIAAGNITAVSGADLAQLDAAMDTLLRYRAEVGAKANRLELAENRLQDMNLSLNRLQSEVEDSDLVESSVELSQLEAAYRVALSAAGRIVQPTLLDFLR